MRKNLIVVRAGDKSLHEIWRSDSDSSNFDIFVSYFGTESNRFSENAEYYHCSAGLKWPILHHLFSTQRDLFESYESYWFPDDDLATDSATISQMFTLFARYDLWLAQPALGPESYVAHPITAAVRCSRLRYTNFVEIMCPIFSRTALKTLGHSFNESVSGWGLDFLWPHLLGCPHDRIAILDETMVTHTRPVGSGSFYSVCSNMGIDPGAEAHHIRKKYGISESPPMRVYRRIPAHNPLGKLSN